MWSEKYGLSACKACGSAKYKHTRSGYCQRCWNKIYHRKHRDEILERKHRTYRIDLTTSRRKSRERYYRAKARGYTQTKEYKAKQKLYRERYQKLYPEKWRESQRKTRLKHIDRWRKYGAEQYRKNRTHLLALRRKRYERYKQTHNIPDRSWCSKLEMLAFARLYREGTHDFIFQMRFKEYFPEVNREFIGDFILLPQWINIEIDGQHWHELHKKEDRERDRIVKACTKLKIVRLRNKEWKRLESD